MTKFMFSESNFWDFQVTQSILSMDPMTLMSNIGGYMGLLLGYSVLQILDMIMEKISGLIRSSRLN